MLPETLLLAAFLQRRPNLRDWVRANSNKLRLLVRMWSEAVEKHPSIEVDTLWQLVYRAFPSTTDHGAWLLKFQPDLQSLASELVALLRLESEIARGASAESSTVAVGQSEREARAATILAKLSSMKVTDLRKLWSRTVKYQEERAFPARKEEAVRDLSYYYTQWYDDDVSVLEENLADIADFGADTSHSVRELRLLNEDRAEVRVGKDGQTRLRKLD